MYKISSNTFYKICKVISILCVLISVVAWILNFYSIGNALWTISLLVSPVGFIMALIILFKYNLKLGILLGILNIIMFFSFFIIMYIGYTYFYPHTMPK